MILTAEFKPQNLSVSVSTNDAQMDVGVPVVKEYISAPSYAGPYTIDPSDETQSFETTGKRFTKDLTVSAIDPDYVGTNVPRRSDLAVDGLDVTALSGYYSTEIVVSASPTLQNKTVNPSETIQTVSYDSNFDGLENVQVNAIPSNYVGSGVSQQNALTVSGNTVSNLIGYYSSVNTATVDSAVWKSATSATVTPTVTINTNNGLIKANVSSGHMITPIQTDGWALHTTHHTVNITGSDTLQLTTVASTTITPTETVQTAVESRRYTVGTVKVAAIPSDYVGSTVPVRSGLSTVGSTVSAQSGYFPNTVSTSVDPVSMRGSSNISVTPSVEIDSDGTVSVTVQSSGDLKPVRYAGWILDTQSVSYKITGSASTQISDPNLISSNLRANVSLFGVVGNIVVPTVTQNTATKVVTFAF